MDFANTSTPHGPLLQAIDVPFVNQIYRLDIISPFALLFYLTSVSVAFAELMRTAVLKGLGCLSLLLYSDELTPGNPLRSDQGRQTLNWFGVNVYHCNSQYRYANKLVCKLKHIKTDMRLSEHNTPHTCGYTPHAHMYF